MGEKMQVNIMTNLLKEAIFKKTYYCELSAFKAQEEYNGCFDGFKRIVDDEVLKEKEEEYLACSAAADTLLNLISENGLYNEYEKIKRKLNV